METESSSIKDYEEFRVKCDSYYINTLMTYDPSKIFTISKIDPLPFQLEDFLALLDDMRTKDHLRALISYETGLGKTIVSGLLIREVVLMDKKEKNRNARILILVPPMAIDQWIKEMDSKFNLKFHKYQNSEDFEYNLLIASMDTLKHKRNYEYITKKGIVWDFVIVDELHRASAHNADGSEPNQRYKLISLLSDRTSHFIGLTATPHDGRTERFVARLRLINKNVNLNNYKDFLKNHNFRRLKKDLVDLNGRRLFNKEVYPPFKIMNKNVSGKEKAFYRDVELYIKNIYTMTSDNPKYGLLVSVMTRLISSSLPAGLMALKRRRDRIIQGGISQVDEETTEKIREYDLGYYDELNEEFQDVLNHVVENVPQLRDELNTLNSLIKMAEGLVNQRDEKLEKVKDILRAHISKNDKVVIFSSFVTTADYIYDELKNDPDFKDKVYLVTGRVNLEDRRQRLQDFLDKGLVLIGTEILGESLNLQKANVLVNYEMPWSPIVFIQRVGRIYRYPMLKDIFIYNVFNGYKIDQRVLEIMYDKIENLIKDFDEGSIEIIGHELTDEEIKNIIMKGYLIGEIEAREELEKKIGNIEGIKKKLEEVINLTEAGKRYVNAKSLIQNPTEIITENDLKNFLKLANELGIAEAIVEDKLVYANCNSIQLEKLDIEDECIKCIIQKARKRSPKPAIFEYNYTSPGQVAVVNFFIENEKGEKETVWKTLAVLTDREVMPYERIKGLYFIGTSTKLVSSSTTNIDLGKAFDNTIAKISEMHNYKIKRQMNLIEESIQYVAENEKEYMALEIDELKKLLNQKIKVEISEIIADLYLKSSKDIGSEYNIELPLRKHEVEMKAMEIVMKDEEKEGFHPIDEHDKNLGYDITSIKGDEIRYIEVKGLSNKEETITLTENEYKVSNYYKDKYYLYVVINPFDDYKLIKKTPPFTVKDKIYITQYLINIKDL